MAINSKKLQKGIALMEMLVSVSIITVGIITLFNLVDFSFNASRTVDETGRAAALAQELMDAVRNIRDNTDWGVDGLGTLTTGISYFSQITIGTPPQWTLVVGEETTNGFTRKVVFDQVFRDANDDIATSGALDSDTLKVTATILWDSKKVELVTYLTNWQ